MGFRFQISGYGGGCEGCKCVECVKLGEKDGENWKAVFFCCHFFNFYRNNSPISSCIFYCVHSLTHS